MTKVVAIIKKNREKLFYVAFCIYLFAYLLYLIQLDTFGFFSRTQCAQAGKIIAGIILLPKILFQGMTKKSIIRAVVVAPFVLLSSFFSGDLNLLMVFLFVLASPGISLRKMANRSLIITSAFFLVVVLCSLIGLLPSAPPEYRMNGVVRYSFGFGHPNQCGLMVFTICLSYTLLRFRKFTLKDLLLYIPAMLFCWLLLDSRTSFGCIAIIGITSFLVTQCTSAKSRVMLMNGYIVVFLLLAAISVVSMIWFDPDNTFFAILNQLLSGRPELANFYFTSELPMPFGTNWDLIDIQIYSIIGFICDNAYAHIILQSGYVTGSLFLLAYLALFLYYRARMELRVETLGLFLCAVYGFTESYAFHFAINYSLIAFGVLVYTVKNYPSVLKRGLALLKALSKSRRMKELSPNESDSLATHDDNLQTEALAIDRHAGDREQTETR